jgi:translation elongation factor EF-1alpha
VKNALAGAFGASCAIVMVAASNNEFEMSLRSTREHILTAYLQGCRSLVVHSPLPLC